MSLKIKNRLGQAIGVAATVFLIFIFAKNPSFPTPDKIIVFLFFFFMIFRQALYMLKRLLPFVLILLVYDSFRGIADQLNSNVNYGLAPALDRFLFNGLPTVQLQNWLWHGHVSWYDFVLYIPYMLHFVLPLSLAVVFWKIKHSVYWHFVTTFSLVSFAAFFTFLVFPAAPPWLASDNHYIEPVIRISSHVWHSLGITDFPSFYNQISPNAVAAIPSLHAAWAFLVFIYVYKNFGRRWGALAALYPILIFVGTVYQGEHYAVDLAVGVIYALLAYKAAPRVIKAVASLWAKLNRRYKKPKTA